MDSKNGLGISENKCFCFFNNFSAANIITTKLFGNISRENPYEITQSLLLTVYLDANRFIKMLPVHGDQVTVYESAPDRGAFEKADSIVYLKGRRRNRSKIMIQAFTGDCPIVLIADRGGSMIASVHSGREGTKKNIVGKTIDCLTALGFKPSRLSAAIWPGICSGCYPLRPEHAAAMPCVPWNKKPSLADIIRWQLIGMDVPQKNITAPNQSKVCSAHSVFDFERGFAFASASRGPNGDRNAVCVAL